MSHALALKYAHNELVTEADLQKVGRLLWQALAIDDAYQSHCKNKGRRICPIIISSQNAAIQQLPWETLYQPDKGFLGKQRDFTLSRHLPETQADNIPLETGPLRVLLFTSMNEEQARLDVEQEQAQLQEALMPWISAGTVQYNVDHWIASCPYCSTECAVDLKLYSTKKSVFRQGDSELDIHAQYNLPKIIRSNKVG